MDKYICTICATVYNPILGDSEENIPPGTTFDNLPDNWTCPVCGSKKDKFRKLSPIEEEKFKKDGFGRFI